MDTLLENSILKWLKLAEFAINIISYIPLLFSFYFIYKNTVFHKNLICLFNLLLIYYTISQIMRFIIAVKEYEYDNVIDSKDIALNYLIVSGTSETKVYGFIRAGCIVAVFATVGTIIIERSFATIQLETYEKNHSNAFLCFCLSYQVSNVIIMIFVIYMAMINLKMIGIWLIANNILGYFALYFIQWFNRRRYCTSLTNLQKYTLSERYQLQENVRTSSGIRRVAAIKFLSNLLIGFIIFTSEYYETIFIQNLIYLILNLSFNFYAFTFIFIGLASPNQNTLGIKIFKYIKRRSKKVTPSTAVSSSQNASMTQQKRENLSKKIRDIDGKRMIFSVEEERKLYFEQLQNGWN